MILFLLGLTQRRRCCSTGLNLQKRGMSSLGSMWCSWLMTRGTRAATQCHLIARRYCPGVPWVARCCSYHPKAIRSRVGLKIVRPGSQRKARERRALELPITSKIPSTISSLKKLAPSHHHMQPPLTLSRKQHNRAVS